MAKSNQRLLTARFQRVNATAFLVLVGVAGVEYHAITRLERRFQFDGYPFALDARDFAEADTPLFPEAGVDQFLIVIAAEPTGVKPARERHFHVVTRITGR